MSRSADPRNFCPAAHASKNIAGQKNLAMNESVVQGHRYPPVTLVLFVLIIALLATWSLEGIDEDVSFVGKPRYLDSLWPLLSSRVLCLCIGLHRLYIAMRAPAITVDIRYSARSKFKAKSIKLWGLRRLKTFTVQSWSLETVYFLLAIFACIYPQAHALNTVVWLLFEVCFATSHLVSAITSFVLLPTAARICAKEGKSIKDHILLSPQGLWLHNANVAMMHLDLFFSQQKLITPHIGAPFLWGLFYICFVWYLALSEDWLPYPFIDFTLPLYISIPLHLGLVAALGTFFLIGVAFDHALDHLGFLSRLLAHLTLLRLVCRFSQKQREVSATSPPR